MKHCGKAAVAGFVLLAVSINCECGDSSFKGSLPEVNSFFVGPSDKVPSIDTLLPIPESDEISIDFGLVEVGSFTRRYLFILNEGTGDLLLTGVEFSSGFSQDFVVSCLHGGAFVTNCPYTTDSPLSVTPGVYLVIEVTYIPSEVGPDSGRFALLLNTTQHHTIGVNLSGEGVSPEIQVCISDCIGDQLQPPCQQAVELCNDLTGKDNLVVNFGDAVMNSRLERDVVIRNQGTRTLQVSRLELLGVATDQFALDLGNSNLPGLLPANAEARILVSYLPTVGGEHHGVLRISSNDTNEPEIEVTLSGRGLAPRVCVDPTLLDFGNVTSGLAVTKSFSLTNCGLLDLELYNVDMELASSQDFSLSSTPSLPATLAVGVSVDIEVQYYPLTAGSDAGGVEIFSNDMTSEPVTNYTGTVMLLGRSVLRACDFQTTPFAVNFGAVEIGQSPTLDLLLSNVGNDPCTLDHAEITANTPEGEFGLPQAPSPNTNFNPGDSLQIRLGYSPANHGQDAGILSLFGNDKDSSEIKVDLNGFGIFPGGTGPIAVCSVNPINAVPFQTVRWYGDQSYDTNNRPLTEYNWSIVSFPPGSAARLVGLGPNRTTDVDLAGDYIAQLVVKNDIGQVSQPCTAKTKVVPTQDLWVEMFWTYSGDDMDLHLLAPAGVPRTWTDCYYVNCIHRLFLPTPDWGVAGYDGDDPRLDLDDIPGTGPENINIADPADGVYTVFIHDYPGTVRQDPNPVTVKVYIDGVLRQTFNNTLSGEDYDWYVCTIDWPSGVITPF